MESKGTVTISIEEYDRLRKSDEALRENRTLVFTYTEYHEKFREYLMENNDALERIKKEWKEEESAKEKYLKGLVQEKESELKLMKHQIKNMSIWGFFKYRKTLK